MMDEHSFYPLLDRWEIADFNTQIANLVNSKFSHPIYGPPKFASKLAENSGIYIQPRICQNSKFGAENFGEKSKFEFGEKSRQIFVDFKFSGPNWIVPPRWAAIRYELKDAANRILLRREIQRSYLADVYEEFDFNGESRQRFGDESLEIPSGRKSADALVKFAEPVVLNYRLVVWKTDPESHTKLWKRLVSSKLLHDCTFSIGNGKRLIADVELLCAASPLLADYLLQDWTTQPADFVCRFNIDPLSWDLLLKFGYDFDKFLRTIPINDAEGKWAVNLLRAAIDLKFDRLQRFMIQALAAAIPIHERGNLRD